MLVEKMVSKKNKKGLRKNSVVKKTKRNYLLNIALIVLFVLAVLFIVKIVFVNSVLKSGAEDVEGSVSFFYNLPFFFTKSFE